MDTTLHLKCTIAGLAMFAITAASPGAAFASDTPDAWLTTKAKVAILSAVGTSGTSVHVDTVDGLVTLHGTVSNANDKRSAEDAARKVGGVKKVRNLLEVVKPKDEKAVTATDADIASAAKAAIREDAALKDETGIAVQSVNKGTVVLDGKASSLSNHLRAIEDVRTVPGVKRVASTIQSPDSKAIRDAMLPASGSEGKADSSAKAGDRGLGGTAKDAYITSATKLRLLADRKTPGMDINVDTTNGVVTLFGTVPNETAKKQAEEEAEKVSGVKKVVNEIKVSNAD